MNILIGISWPFANGELHIGHAASSLSGDVIARYHRLKGNKVTLVSGTDCHGTPTDIKALQTGRSPKEIVDECHNDFSRAWERIGFSFDLYNRTDDPYHKKIVQENFLKYYEKGLIYEKTENQYYCDHCQLFLADRYVLGTCPKCGGNTKGDECDKCLSLLKPEEITETKCGICSNPTVYKETKHLYFAFSKFQENIAQLVNNKRNDWRENAVLFTERYLQEGIPDRCCTRSLKWGIDVPVAGFEDKKIYVWCENVIGYLTACRKYCESVGWAWEDFWKQGHNNKLYFVHAKDNIPFHTIILPSLLIGLDDNYTLPDKIVSDEYLTIEGEKLSKSSGNYISVNDILDRYPADIVRYYLLSNDPSKRDFNFTWEGFINASNGELLGKWGNLINRNLVFINKSFEGNLELSDVNEEIESKLISLYKEVGSLIDNGNIKEGLELIFDFINFANKYFDENEPWNLYKTDRKKCNDILYNCVNIIYNVNNLLKPYLPFSATKVDNYLDSEITEWKYTKIEQVAIASEITPLYPRYDKQLIQEETEKLKNIKDQNQ